MPTESMALALLLCTVQVLLHLAHASSVRLGPTRRGQVSHPSHQSGDLGACIVLIQFRAALSAKFQTAYPFRQSAATSSDQTR